MSDEHYFPRRPTAFPEDAVGRKYRLVPIHDEQGRMPGYRAGGAWVQESTGEIYLFIQSMPYENRGISEEVRSFVLEPVK